MFKKNDRVIMSEIYSNPPLLMGGTVIGIPPQGTTINDNDISGIFSSEWNWDACNCTRDQVVRHSIIFDGERHYFVRMDNRMINLVSYLTLKKEPRQIYTASAAGFKKNSKKKYRRSKSRKSKKNKYKKVRNISRQ
jgi:hypothetical protein